MVAAQVSPLERRELLDGTTGYGSYDPYGTSSSGSDSGSSSSSGYSDSSMSGSMSGSSPMAPSGNGSTPGGTSGSPNGSQPPATVGTINVRVAGPNEPMNRWTDLNLNGAASSDGNTGATGPTGTTGPAGTAAAYSAAASGTPTPTTTVIDPLTVFSDVPFIVSGDYFGPGAAEVYVEKSDGTPEIFPITGDHFEFSVSVKAKGAQAWVRGSVRNASGPVNDSQGNPAIDEASDNVVTVQVVSPREVILSTHLQPGPVKDWFISKTTAAIHQKFLDFSGSGAVESLAADLAYMNPGSSYSQQDYVTLIHTTALPYMEQAITTGTVDLLTRGFGEVFNDHGFTFSVSMGASSPYLAAGQQTVAEIINAAARGINFVTNAQNAFNDRFAPFVHVDWVEPIELLTSQNVMDVVRNPNGPNFANAIRDTPIIHRLDVFAPLDFNNVYSWLPNAKVGLHVTEITLDSAKSYGVYGELATPLFRLPGPIPFYIQAETSYGKSITSGHLDDEWNSTINFSIGK